MKLEMITAEMKNHVPGWVEAEAKEASVLWLRDKALPAMQEVASAYTAALHDSSEQEKGWCRFRDRLFLPCLVDGTLWLAGKALEGMAAKQGE